MFRAMAFDVNEIKKYVFLLADAGMLFYDSGFVFRVETREMCRSTFSCY